MPLAGPQPLLNVKNGRRAMAPTTPNSIAPHIRLYMVVGWDISGGPGPHPPPLATC